MNKPDNSLAKKLAADGQRVGPSCFCCCSWSVPPVQRSVKVTHGSRPPSFLSCMHAFIHAPDIWSLMAVGGSPAPPLSTGGPPSVCLFSFIFNAVNHISSLRARSCFTKFSGGYTSAQTLPVEDQTWLVVEALNSQPSVCVCLCVCGKKLEHTWRSRTQTCDRVYVSLRLHMQQSIELENIAYRGCD